MHVLGPPELGIQSSFPAWAIAGIHARLLATVFEVPTLLASPESAYIQPRMLHIQVSLPATALARSIDAPGSTFPVNARELRQGHADDFAYHRHLFIVRAPILPPGFLFVIFPMFFHRLLGL